MRTSVALRRSELLPRLNRDRVVHVEDLAAQLGISEVTVRRDLRALEETGLVKRTHGGAILSYDPGEELPYELAAEIRKPQKDWIGRAAFELVRHGESILVDAGTTMASFVRALSGKRDLKIVTSSIRVMEIAAREDWIVLCPGGVLRNKSLAFVGPVAERGLESIRVETLFLAFNAICREGWVYSIDSLSASLKQIMISCAAKIVAMGDSSKINKTGLIRVAPLSAIDILVTDDELKEEDLSWLLEQGIVVILAGPRASRRFQSAKAKPAPSALQQVQTLPAGAV